MAVGKGMQSTCFIVNNWLQSIKKLVHILQCIT